MCTQSTGVLGKGAVFGVTALFATVAFGFGVPVCPNVLAITVVRLSATTPSYQQTKMVPDLVV